MTEYYGRGTNDREPCSVHVRIDADARQFDTRQPGHGEQSLAHVDDDHAERERPALGAQRIGPAGVAADLGADVDAAQCA
mgnify:CR=1 FL=1